MLACWASITLVRPGLPYDVVRTSYPAREYTNLGFRMRLGKKNSYRRIF